MRVLAVLLSLLATGAFLAACGPECGDGTEEEDGECVVAVLSGDDLVRECSRSCPGTEGPCESECAVRAAGAPTRGCQACLIGSFAEYYRVDGVSAAQAACVPYCTE